MKVRFNCVIMKKQSFLAILMLLAACNSDSSEEEQPPVKDNLRYHLRGMRDYIATPYQIWEKP